MRTILLLLLLSGATWAQTYIPHPRSEIEAIADVNGLKDFCKGLQARKAEQDAGKWFQYPITQAEVDYTCKERIPVAEKALADKAWLKKP